MPLIWSPSAQQVTNLISASGYSGSTATITVFTQGFTNGGSIYYSTTGSGVQVSGPASINNYLGDLGTATIPIATSRSTTTVAFTVTFFTGNLSGPQISSIPQVGSLAPPDANFTSTVLLLSPAGPSTITAFSDISGTTSTINIFGSPNIRSFAPFVTLGASSSIFFNGNPDYLKIPGNSAFSLGTGDFTVEFWTYSTVNARQDWFDLNDGVNPRLLIYYNGTNIAYTPNNVDRITGPVLTLNTWQHITVCRIAGSSKMYINGQQVGSTYTDSTSFPSAPPIYIGKDGGGSTYVTGYISNIRIVKGLGVYTGTFTPPSSPLQVTQSAGTNISAITAGQTSLLLAQATQSYNNNSFYDSANTLTQVSYVGTPTSGTFSPFFQPYGTYITAAGQILTNPNANFQFPGQFTIELWIYLLATPTPGNVLAGVGSSGGVSLYIATDGTLSINLFGTGDQLTSTYTPPVRTWVHLAIARNNANAIGIFAAGARIASTTLATSYTGSTGFKVGTFGAECYIANLRVTKGSFLYDPGSASPYTVPPLTTPLAATAETVLLAGQINTFPRDNSTYRNTLTFSTGVVNQSISTTTFLTSPYSTSTNIGSVYFNGLNDYLTTTGTVSGSVVNFGTGNFTVDFWMYLTKLGVNQAMVDTRYPNVANTGFDISVSNTNQLRFGTNGTFYVTGATTLITNQWHHVAVVRNINTMTLYLNGVQDGTNYNASGTQNFVNTTATIANGVNGYFNGFISNLRAINGYAAYSYAGSFIPPITPTTASLTGTTMIINGNNSAIYDSSGFHNIQTVGTATLTTSTVKFGSSSIKATPTTAYLSITTSSNALLQFGTGPFTIEAWIQVLATSGQKVIYDNRNPDTANVGFDFFINTSNILIFGTNGTAYISGSTVLTNGLWYHVAVVRESPTVIKMYLNGVQEGSTYGVSQNFTNYITKIGSGVNGNFNGYISDLRVSRIARYTGNFTTATTFNPPI